MTIELSNFIFAFLVVTSLASFVGSLETRDFNKGFSSPCGTPEKVANRIGRCLEPIFEIPEGKVPNPKGDADLQAVCERFSTSEKCVRGTSKDCLKGLHKTVTSAVASASRRFRLQECKNTASREKYYEPMLCTTKKGKDLTKIMRNHTAIVQAIRDDPKLLPEHKLMKTCCIWAEMDREMEQALSPDCTKSAPLILGIIHAMTEDARNTVCIRPRCEHALDGYLRRTYKPPQNFIEPIMEVLFMLSSETA